MVELSESRREYVQKNFPIDCVTDQWKPILNRGDIDAVVVATPASTHAQLVREAMAAGKHVFVEKPLAMTQREADELIFLAKRKNKVLMVGHTFLYNPAVRFLKSFIEKEEVGDIYYIYSHRLNLGQVRSDVNVWWNLGPHDVSILLYLMNERLPSSISVRGMDYLQKDIEDVVFATLEWENGMLAHIQLSWLDPNKVRKMTIVGSRKMIVYDDVAEDKIAVFDKGVDRVPVLGEKMHYDQAAHFHMHHRVGDVYIPKLEFEEPLKIEMEHFVDCVRSGATPLTGGTHASNVVAVLEAGERALRLGTEEKVIGSKGLRLAA